MFYERKLEILHNLSKNVDFSPKGSIDAPVAELVSFINSLDGYVTTSSCSGRISIYRSNSDILRANNSNKGVLWLMVSHQLVNIGDIRSLLNREMALRSTADGDTSAGDVVYLKCEGFILHVLCKDLEQATKLLQIALQVGYRESGITISGGSYSASADQSSRPSQKQTKSSVMLAIRSTAFTFEVPLATSHGGRWWPLVGMEPVGVGSAGDGESAAVNVYPYGLDLLVDQANDKLKQNFSRADKLMASIKANLVIFPRLHCAPGGDSHGLSSQTEPRWGHASAGFTNDEHAGGVVILGGYEPCGSTSGRAKKVGVASVSGAIVPFAPSTSVLKITSSSEPGALDTEFVHSTVNACSMGWINMGGRKAPQVSGENSADVTSARGLLRVLDADMQKLLPHLDLGEVPLAESQPRWGHSCTRLARKEDEVYIYDRKDRAQCAVSDAGVGVGGMQCDKYLVFGGRCSHHLSTEHYLLERVALAEAGGSVEAGAYPGGVWRWTKLDIDSHVLGPRCFHAAVLVPNSPYSFAVLIHGGMLSAPMTTHSSDAAVVSKEMAIVYPLDAAQGRSVRCMPINPTISPGCGALSRRDMARFGHTLTDIGAKCLLLCGGLSPHDAAGSNDCDIPNTHAASTNAGGVDGPASPQGEFIVCLDVSTAHNFSKDDVSEVVINARRLPVPAEGACLANIGFQRAHHQAVLVERVIEFGRRGAKSKGAVPTGQLAGLDLPLPHLVLIGGGGQCLSFGTFFNPSRTLLVSSSEYKHTPLTTCPTEAKQSVPTVPPRTAAVQTALVKPTTSGFSEGMHAVLVCPKPLTKAVKSLLETVTASQAGTGAVSGLSRCARKHGYYDKNRRINPISALQLLQLMRRSSKQESVAQGYIHTLVWRDVDSAAPSVTTPTTPSSETKTDELVAIPITLELENLLTNIADGRHKEQTEMAFVSEIFKCVSSVDLHFGKIPADLLYSGSAPVPKTQTARAVLASWYSRYGVDEAADPSAATYCYPKKFELVGKDVVMIPSESLLNDLYEQHLGGNDRVSVEMLQELWSLLVAAFGCSRAARKAEISSNLRRESRVKLLFKTPEFESDRLVRILAASKGAGTDPLAVEKSEGWVTVTENKVKFGFDISKVMFCSGNCTERMRMGRVKCAGEIIYDLYCGIGYYTVPLLYYGGARHVYACEWNPNSVAALKSNLNYQRICSSRATLIEGDNRVNVPQLQLRVDDAVVNSTTAVPVVAPGDRSYQAYPHYNSQTISSLLCAYSESGGLPRADRVMLGLLPSSRDGWRLGVAVLKRAGGVMHVHENVHERLLVKPTADMCGSDETIARDVPTAELTAEIDGYFPEFLVKRFKALFREHDEKYQTEGQILKPMDVRVVHVEFVKSYAPRVYHIVVDLLCKRLD